MINTDKTLQEDIRNFTEKFPFANELKGKTFVVTGATGLLGSVMVKCLTALNEKYNLGLSIVAVVRNLGKAMKILGKETETMTPQMFDFASDCKFDTRNADYVIHFANPTLRQYIAEHPAETMKVCFNGTESVLEYARFAKLKSMVYVSAVEIYGVVTDDSTPLTEEMQGYINPSNIISSYPMAKRGAESLCAAYAAEYGVPVKTARLAQTFGAGMDPVDDRDFSIIANSILDSSDIVLHGTGEQGRSYCYTIDAINAILFLLLRGKNGEAYNVANPDTYISKADMVKALCKDFNPKCKAIIKPYEEGKSPAKLKLKMDTSKIEKLGWKPEYDLKTMFTRLFASLKERQKFF